MDNFPKYDISENTLTIYGSCDVSKHDFSDVLDTIQSEHPVCNVFIRPQWHLKLEWATHNLLCKLNFLPEQTCTLDLEYPQNVFLKIGYTIFGAISWIFIK